MSDSGNRKSIEDVIPIGTTNSDNSSGNPHVNGQERKPLAPSNSLRTGPLSNFTSNEISNAIAKQAQALQHAAALLQQHNNDQPMVMAKKSNASQPSIKNNTSTASGMVQLNLVNENGTVTPIEVNASVAAAAALVAAQKHQNQRLEGASTGSLNTLSMNGTGNVSIATGNSSKQTDFGTKPTKGLPISTSCSTSNVSITLTAINVK